MVLASIESKVLVGGSDIPPADLLAGGLYGNLYVEILTVSTFCNSLKASQIVGRIAAVGFDLALVSESYKFIMKVLNGTQPSIESRLIQSQQQNLKIDCINVSAYGCSSDLVKSTVRERMFF